MSNISSNPVRISGDTQKAKNQVCNECNRSFLDKNALRLHMLTCIKPKKGASFYNAWIEPGGNGRKKRDQHQNEQTEIEKIALPPSQPDTENVVDQIHQQTNEPQEITTLVKHECEHCHRSFTTSRGLQQHKRKCRGNPALNNEKKDNDLSEGQAAAVAMVAGTTTSTAATTAELSTTSMKEWAYHSSDDLQQVINAIYEEVVFWKKNVFKLPSGAAGKRYIKQTTRLIETWNEEKLPLCNIALKMVMIMPAILLQKPCRKSTSKQHSEYLNKRLALWEEGEFDQLMRETRAIQHRAKQQSSRHDDTSEHNAKVFAKLMLQGKVHAALRLLDKKENALGVAELKDETMKNLLNLHPEAKEAREDTLITGELPFFDPVVFTNINEQSIAKAAMRTRGAAGPSGLDADGWRRMLVSKNYGSTGKDLRTAIARMSQHLATRKVTVIPGTNTTSIEAYVSCRLIPLNKDPTGIRPIGIGEVLRRIIGKAVITEIKPEIMESAGCLQLCAGQKAGCEAATHAMKEIFEEEETDAVLFIDASNAFNSLNREALLHNIQYLCPTMSTYVRNCYRRPSRLFIAGGKEIKSAEGTTQGDPTAMPSYGVGILPFLSMIKPEGREAEMKHLAYADDIGGGSKLQTIYEWWTKIEEHGPSLGYYPKPSKSWLVVKEDKFDDAYELFKETGINITTEGRKYLGGFVGTREATEKYISELRDEWILQLEELTKIARSEPQAAYAAFTAGFQHKMTYFIRVIPDLAEILKPLDDFIDNNLLPALTEGHVTSAEERRLLSLPVRLGGLGIPIYHESCTHEYENSRKATQLLTPRIVTQESEFIHDKKKEKEIEAQIRAEREKIQKQSLEKLRRKMTQDQIRGNDLAQMKGASAWLTSLPLKEEGYVLNKREFYDAISLRYRWQLKRLPLTCVCGKRFEMDHAMSCMTGGYIHRRHDRLRDLFAQLIDDVAHEVRIEPPLQPLSGEILPNGANTEDEARLDVAARGFWQECEMAFFDIKVFNPFAKSHLRNNLESVFRTSETIKKKRYNERVIRIEHGSFTPIVASSFGGFGKETSCFMSRLIDKIAKKKDMEKSVVANYVRTKVSYELIRSQVACIRGSRSLWKKPVIDTGEIEIVNNLAKIQEG